MVRRSGSLRGTSGLTLHTLNWRPQGDPSALAILVHGYAEHAGRYEALARTLVARGFAVGAVDFAGHGRSTGRRGVIPSYGAQVADLAAFLGEQRNEFPSLRCGLFGHSAGGATAAMLCAQRPEIVDALVLSAPYLRHGEPVNPVRLRLVRTLARLLPRFGIERIDPRKLSHLPSEIEAYRNDPLVFHGKAPAATVIELFEGFEALESADRIVTPLLVLHGSHDRIADPSGSRRLVETVASPDVTLEIVDGGYHELLNDLGRERTHARVADWLEARLVP